MTREAVRRAASLFDFRHTGTGLGQDSSVLIAPLLSIGFICRRLLTSPPATSRPFPL